MSTAARFKFRRTFPFCVTDISGDVRSNASYVGNLTLAQVMEFAWNLEEFTITPAGTATLEGLTTVSPPTIVLNPLSYSNISHGSFNDGSMWYGDGVARTTLGELPSIRGPVGRICNPTMAVNGCLFDFNADDDASPSFLRQFEIGFWVGSDPSNSGKFRIYYILAATTTDDVASTLSMDWSNQESSAGMSLVTSGTGEIGGIAFPWYIHCTAGATASSASISISSTAYTY
jgi:hypothetical protein